MVGHNCIDFDFYWFSQLLGIDVYDFGFDIRDSYILSRLAAPKRTGGHSVAAWGERFNLVKTQIKDEQWATFDPIMVTRCVGDVEIQEKVYEHLREKELRGFSLECIELEHEVQKIISQQKRDGVYIDETKVLSLYATCKRKADRLRYKIQEVFPPRSKLIKEFNPKETKNGTLARNTIGKDMDPSVVAGPYSRICFEPFNVDSPSQRVERLLEIGWIPSEYTKPTESSPEGRPKFTDESLENLPSDAPRRS